MHILHYSYDSDVYHTFRFERRPGLLTHVWRVRMRGRGGRADSEERVQYESDSGMEESYTENNVLI
jgi:hypothetical protein